MSNAYIQVPPQSTGLKVQTFENTVGGNIVESEAVTLVQSSDNTEVGVVGQPLRVDPTGTTTQPISGAISFTAPQHTIIDSGTITAVTSITNPIHAVVDSGTLTAVTAITNPLPAGTNVIGHVLTDSGSVSTVTFSAPQHTIVDSGSIVATGSGVFEVGPTTAANTKTNTFFNQIGDGTNVATFNGTTTTSKLALDINVLSILGTAPTAAGKLDVKAADGDVFVRSTTAANFLATVSQGATDWKDNLDQVAGVSLGATAVVNYGSTPAAVAVPAVNAFITNSPAVTLTSTTVTGNVSVVGTTTDGSTTETSFLVVGGESNDATAQYQPIPLGTGGRSVIIEGVASGTAVPVSGTVAVTNFANPLPVSESGAWNVNQTLGTPAYAAVTDGTNGPAAVKPASTPAVATDAALVVAISPNNSLTVSNASVGLTGKGVPGSTDLVGGGDQGNLLRSLQVDQLGGLILSPENSINDLLTTLILEVRAMRTAIVYMVTETGSVIDKDFDPANPDFQPIN